jgi:hypothetical protein
MMISKPGKPLEEASSYRLISLLPVMRKILEKVMLKRLHPSLEGKKNFVGLSVWISTATLHHRTSPQNYRDSKRKFTKKKQHYRRNLRQNESISSETKNEITNLKKLKQEYHREVSYNPSYIYL